MKLQFSVRAMLVITTFVAIWVGSFAVCWNRLATSQRMFFLQITFSWSPFWLPAVFLAYALGRRVVNWKIVAGFAVAEIAAVGAVVFLGLG